MGKIKNLFLGILMLSFIFTANIFAQEDPKEEFKPVFITFTKTQRTAVPEVDFSGWEDTEKEYFDKVTMKNDLIIGSGFYVHYFTPDDSEILLVSVYETWEDIEKATEISNKLVEEAWPDEELRNAFFEKQGSYYEDGHSDEIYASLQFSKPLKTASEEPLIYYLKVNELGEGGSGFKEYFENVTLKNNLVKGYYTFRHRWGANSKEALEVFVFDTFSDIENSFDENTRLIKEHWPDEEKSKEFFKEYRKIFSGHGDYIYTNVPRLAK